MGVARREDPVYAGFELELAGVEGYRARMSGWLAPALGCGSFRNRLYSVASTGDGDNLGVIEQAIKDGTGGRYIA
jgi:hypothetical protein